MCVCIQPSLVFSRPRSKRFNAMWSTMVSPEVENVPRQPSRLACGVLSAGDSRCVCHSLVHWTLPLHRVLLFSPFFSLYSTAIFWIQLWSWRFPVLTSVIAVAVTFFFSVFVFSLIAIFNKLYCILLLLSLSVYYSFSVSHTVPVLSLPNSDLSFSLFSLYVLNYDFKRNCSQFFSSEAMFRKTCARIKL